MHPGRGVGVRAHRVLMVGNPSSCPCWTGWGDASFDRLGFKGLASTTECADREEVLRQAFPVGFGGQCEVDKLHILPVNSQELNSFYCFDGNAPQDLRSQWSAAASVMLRVQSPHTQHFTTTFDFHADICRTVWLQCSSWPQLQRTLSSRLDPSLIRIGLIPLGPEESDMWEKRLST